MVPVAKKVGAGATTAALAATIAIAHVSRAPLRLVVINPLTPRVATNRPMPPEAKGTGVMHLAVTSLLVVTANAALHHVVIVQPLPHEAISPLSLHAAIPHAVTAPSAAIASVLSLLVETSPLLHRVATSHLVASAHHAATILTPAHAQIVRRLTVLPMQVSQHAQAVSSHRVRPLRVARPLHLAATAQLARALRVQARHVPQPVRVAALPLTAVAVKVQR